MNIRKWTSLILVLVLTLAWIIPAAAQEAGPGQTYLVVFKGEEIPQEAGNWIAQAGGKVKKTLDELGVAVVEAPSPSFAEKIGKKPQVEEVNRQGWVVAPRLAGWLPAGELPEGEGADLYEAYQWDIQRVTRGGQSFDLETGSHEVVVGIIDSGVDYSHPDLAANIVAGGRSYVPGSPLPEDDLGHGTFVAGTIAANGRILGVAPNVGIRPYKIFGSDGYAPTERVVQAIMDATDDGVEVINMSFNGFALISTAEGRADFKAWTRALKYAMKKGVTVVAAAGNEGLDLDNKHKVAQALGEKGAAVDVPGAVPGVITVSATTKDDDLAFYSNYGITIIDLAAPGGDLGPDPANPDLSYLCFGAVPMAMGGYNYGGGSSMAAPKVAAVAALIIAKEERALSPAQVASRLYRSAEDLGKRGRDQEFGRGLVDAYEALCR